MVIFSKKKVESDTLGERLKKIRQKTGVSLAEIAQATKIRKQYLELIENNDFGQLPPDVYVKGFLKSYASFLGIEADDVIKLYKKERGIEKAYKKIEEKNNGKKKKRVIFPVLTITPRWIAFIVSFLLIIVGGVYFYQEVSRFSKTPSLVITQPIDKAVINDGSVEVIGLTDKENKVLINGQPIAVNQQGEFHQIINLQAGLNQLEVKAVNRFERAIAKKINLVAEFEDQVISQNEESQTEQGEETMEEENNLKKTEGDKLILEISVREIPVWISVSVDNQNSQSETMLAGSTKRFEANERISITSGKANQTFIKVNGHDIGALGQSPGIVREVVFENKNNPSAGDKQEERKQESEEIKKEENNSKKETN